MEAAGCWGALGCSPRASEDAESRERHPWEPRWHPGTLSRCHLRTPARCDPSSTPRAGRTRRPGARRRGGGGSRGPGAPPGCPRPCPTPRRGCRRAGDPGAASPAGPRPAEGTLGTGHGAVGGARDPREGAGGARGVTVTHLWPPRRNRPRAPGPARPRRAPSTRSHLGPAGGGCLWVGRDPRCPPCSPPVPGCPPRALRAPTAPTRVSPALSPLPPTWSLCPQTPLPFPLSQ